MKNIFLLLLPFLILSCNQKTNKNDYSEDKTTNKTEVDHNLDWLIGNWKRLNEEAGKETFENWQKIAPTHYSGLGFTLHNADTISQEKMEISRVNGNWKLLVKMPNEKAATEFKITEIKNNRFFCINDSIDFPNKIEYYFDGNNLKANISNNDMEIPFVFEKIK